MHSTNQIPMRIAAGLLAIGLFAPVARAEDDARAILKSMSDYLAKQPSFSAKFDSDVEVVTTDRQKIQFASSGTIAIRRPDKLHAVRTGGYADAEMIFNGKQLAVYARNAKLYAKIDSPGSIDELITKLEGQGYVFPGADLLMSNVYAELNAGVLDAKHIGTGVINGVRCEHLAFRNADTDWQLWVRSGREPIPCKYVITSKDVAGAPQYTLTLRDWSSNVTDDFAFVPPAGVKLVDAKTLPSTDEVPEGASK